ncbi:hypothetical protein MF672_010660 [Actinomadura sp. ATCC 31491]|uniref:Uncharacterized protein n=1 Tax=Actinomadura luzonensis TaxID=2805427 RepID=A0ABT0FPK7_9ACTN|nr:hypothetical protein [Actinomadura luzonensis]MCK2214247.1 hypothetical protein [Actinomadura luzonensis]
MTALPDDASAVRLYSSAEAAKIVRGGDDSNDPDRLRITKATFDRLGRSGAVECTMIGRKRGWTLAQIAAVVAYCATSGGGEAKAPAPTPRESRSHAVPALDHRRGSVAPLATKRGSRYAASTC